MKKNLALLSVCLMMACLLCACGGGGSDKAVWSIEKSTDDFGDVTEDSYEAIASTIKNSEASEKEFEGKVYFLKNQIGGYLVGFTLNENGEKPVDFSGSVLTLKVKLDDTIDEYSLACLPSGQQCVLGGQYCDYSGSKLFNALYNGKNPRCILSVNDVSYQFELNSGNFNSLCKKNKIDSAPEKMTTAEAVSIYVTDNGVYHWEAYYNLFNNLDNMPKLGSGSILEELKGRFVYIGFIGDSVTVNGKDYSFPQIYEVEFADDKLTFLATYDMPGGTYKNMPSREYEEKKNPTSHSLSVQDDLLQAVYPNGNQENIYVYKLSDNIYLYSICKENSTEHRNVSMLVRKSGSGEAGINTALNDAFEYDVPLVQNYNTGTSGASDAKTERHDLKVKVGFDEKEKTVDELIKEYDEDVETFIGRYSGAQIKFVGTVKDIKGKASAPIDSDSVVTDQHLIIFEEGLYLIIGEENSTINVADYNVGDKLTVTTGIIGAPFQTEYLKGLSDNERVLWLVGNETIFNQTWNDITTVIEK